MLGMPPNPGTSPSTSGSPAPAGGSEALEDAKRARAREYRRRYNDKKKGEAAALAHRVEATQSALAAASAERSALLARANALEAACIYASDLARALAAAAARSAAGGAAALRAAHERASHAWTRLPTAVELVFTKLWNPTEAQMRTVARLNTVATFQGEHERFVARLRLLLTEADRDSGFRPTAMERMNAMVSFFIRFTLIAIEEQGARMEAVLCKWQLQSKREAEARGEWREPPRDRAVAMAAAPPLDTGQRRALADAWKTFEIEIKVARSELADAVAAAAAAAGETTPASCATAKALAFLETTKAAQAAQRFVDHESSAYFELFRTALRTLSPLQMAHVIATYRPLITHLPDVYTALLTEKGG